MKAQASEDDHLWPSVTLATHAIESCCASTLNWIWEDPLPRGAGFYYRRHSVWPSGAP